MHISNLYGLEARKGDHEGMELELGARAYTRAAGFNLFLGGGDLSPIGATIVYIGAHLDFSPITRGFIELSLGLNSVVCTYVGQRSDDEGLV